MTLCCSWPDKVIVKVAAGRIIVKIEMEQEVMIDLYWHINHSSLSSANP